ncbi:MAG: cell wall metabolism sensor histidine kinase WalK [Chloroflexaceae bacterium]|nr:cell wall metabolism sensor histidine kinase WalK [Chloroflexaceae bacterium]
MTSLDHLDHLRGTDNIPRLHSRVLRRLGWSNAGIRTKILAPLIILMTLSLLGSTVGFIISTNTTRNRILDGQLQEEAQRMDTAIKQSEENVKVSASTLPGFAPFVALLQEIPTDRENAVPEMGKHALTVRDRYRLDQVIIIGSHEEAPWVNLATSSALSQMEICDHAELATCTDPSYLRPGLSEAQVHLLTANGTRLIVGCAPIWDTVTSGTDTYLDHLGTVYTVQDIPSTLERIRRERGLTAEVQLVDKTTLSSPHPALASTPSNHHTVSIDGFRVRHISISLTSGTLDLFLLLSEQQINRIVGSGLQVMLVSSGLTLVLLLAVGFWLAQGFSLPILKLVGVARSVAAGDLSQRANLRHNDEIGQLGRAFDYATTRITDLLDEKARRAGELHAILQSMADGVLAVDTHERIVMVNPMAASLLGQDTHHLLSRPLSTLTNVDNPVLATGLQQVVDQMRNELANPATLWTEEHVSLGERIVRLHSAPTLGSGGTLTGAVVAIQDITQAVEADRAKSAFIGTASHEMRTPLAAMKGFVDIFYMSGIENLTDNQRMFLDTIRRQTESMVQMVNDLLEMARLEQGTLRGEQRWVSVGQAIDESVSSLKLQIEQRQIDLHLDIAPTLPPIWIDSIHIRRILVNLLSNAVKYVHQGGQVSVRAYELSNPALLPSPPEEQPWKSLDPRSVVIEVEDNGVGIRKADQAKIFTRFFRSENSLSVEAGGSGLGLAITQSLVHLHHGQIGFRSVEQEGSCFWVRIPAPSTEALHDGVGAGPPVYVPEPTGSEAWAYVNGANHRFERRKVT